MKTKKSLVSVLFILFLSVSGSMAQTGKNIFELPIDTTLTYDAIVAKYGEPKDIRGSEGSLRSLYYQLNVPDDYMYGWLVLKVNSHNKFCGYNIKGQNYSRETQRSLDYFKSKFQLSDDLVNLFYLNEKELAAKLSANGYSMQKNKSGLDFVNEFQLKGENPLYNSITISVGKGKTFEKSKDELYNRQGKIYQIDVYYANAFL